MKKFKKVVKVILIIVFIVVVVFLIKLIWFKPSSIELFFNRVMITNLLKDPQLVTSLKIPMLYHFKKDDLNDISVKQQHKLNSKTLRDLKTSRKYKSHHLSNKHILSKRIIEWYLQDRADGIPYCFHNYPVNQFNGIQNDLPSYLDTYHQVNSKSDAHAYIVRLSKIPDVIEQAIEGMKLRKEMNISPPKFVLEKVLREMNDFVKLDAEENILFTSFQKKLMLTDLQNKNKYLEKAKAEIETSVYPAYLELIAYTEELLISATKDDGVWKFPDGDDYYEYALKHQTTLDVTPEEIFTTGLNEVIRIQEEMRLILESLGYNDTSISVIECMLLLAAKQEFLYTLTKQGREQCLDDYKKLLDEINDKVDEVFEFTPGIGLVVKRIPVFKEATSSLAYYDYPPLDGSSPGIFYVRLDILDKCPTFDMPTLAYHEGIPGHHFQLTYHMEMKGIPLYRKLYSNTAYVEGWAMYSEQLAWELGMYDGDPYGNLGRLSSELFRAVRLVVDCGIHHKRWTREEAIKYMQKNTALTEEDIVAEVERYIVDPGQACSYKVGMMKILELREKAKTKMGKEFDIMEFHKVVLDNGMVPLKILEQLVDQYINEES